MQIAILGGGPIGLEAAVALDTAGHAVTVYEAGPSAGWSVQRWAHVTMFTPWRMNTTAAGRARLGDPAMLHSDEFPTGGALAEHYLLPLAATLDLRCGHRVVGVARQTLTKGQELGADSRTRQPFRLLLRTTDPGGEQEEQTALADVVVDCTGTFDDPAPAGPGGLHVPGERAVQAAGRLHHAPCPTAGLANSRVLVVGDGASATTALADLLDDGATITWLTPGTQVPGFHSPPDDRLPGRRALWQRGRRAASLVDHRPQTWIERMDLTATGVRVTLDEGRPVDVDHVVVATGFRPDNRLLRELQFHVCWGSEGPMKLSAALLATRGGGGGDCLDGAALVRGSRTVSFENVR